MATFYSILKQALPFSLILKQFNPHQPRDATGKWTDTGAAGARSAVAYNVASKLREGYPNNVTEAEVMARFSNGDRYQLQRTLQDLAEEVQRGHETNKYYTADVNGKSKYTAERQALHQSIVNKIITPALEKAAKSATPTVMFLGGRGGSGKSSFSTEGKNTLNIYDPKKSIVIDADKIKEMLGAKGDIKYKGWNAYLFHEESNHVRDMVTKAAKDRGLNIVLDATLKTDKTKLVQRFKKAGYSVEAHYMFLPEPIAAQRAFERFKTEKNDFRGRLVPPSVILGNKDNEKNFDKLIPLVDNWSVYRNDVSKGSPPKFVSGKE